MKRLLPILIFILFVDFAAEGQLNINHYMRVGRTRISIGNYTGAIEYFNIVIKFKPYLPEAFFYRGIAKHRLEDFRGAILDYDEAIKLKPFYPQAYMNRGMAWHDLKEYEKAIFDYNQGLDFDPEDESMYNNRGIAKLALKDVDGALADYDKALSINSKSVFALMNRSNAHIVKGDVEEAIRDLNRVIIIRPHYGAAYLNRGLARFEQDDFASALRDYDQSIRLDPDNAMAYNNRGIVKHKLGDYGGAIVDYDKALSINSQMASAYFNRAMAKELMGRPGFEDDYKNAAILNPQFDLSRRYVDSDHLASNPPTASADSTATDESNIDESIADSTGSDDKDDAESDRSRHRQRINLIVEDSRDLPADEEDEDDGRVQNRNIEIDLQPIFIISASERGIDEYDRAQYYNLAIDELNQLNNYNPSFIITNRVSKELYNIFENYVLYFNARIEISKSSRNYLNRGVFYALTGNYSLALDDLNSSIEMDEKQAMAYFSRANTRYLMLEQIKMAEGNRDNETVSFDQMQLVQDREEGDYLPEYDKMLDDYQVLIYLKPDFFFGYFNRAYIKLRLREYKSAIEDLNRTLEMDPELAEAWFNRGLTKIYLNDIDGGALDLSKAGELGIQGAYNIIKRYCN